MRSLLSLLAALALSGSVVSSADARRPRTPLPVPVMELPAPRALDAPRESPGPRLAAAANDTTWLYVENFETGASCDASGWTEFDRSLQTGDYFHVDDYAGLPFGPVRGTKSLWCGARASSDPIHCSYATLPGYGNDWDQAFCTKACLTYTGTVSVDWLARWDTEPGYDAVEVQYTTDCDDATSGFPFAGGADDFDGIGSRLRHDTFPAPAYPVKIRIRFRSDGVWSDQDGWWPTDGALHLDSLSVRDASGLRIPVEDFEDEAVGATSTTHWESCTPPGFGSYAFLPRGMSVLQEDQCTRDLSCLWAFFEGSTYDYAWGGHPAQKVVPYGNARGQYLDNEVWSPPIPLSGAGARVVLQFVVYRDLPLECLVFYTWRVRSITGGRAGPWKDRNYLYYGYQKDWFSDSQSVGDLLDLAGASHVQVALGGKDMCAHWCGIYGAMSCHTHAPLFDTVKLYRVNFVGPQWSVRDLDTFQDSFAHDGTLTGTVRADMASDVLPYASAGILPGDSSVVSVSDPVHGLAPDPADPAKAAVYCYVSVRPAGQPGKSGAGLSGGARWPHVGTQAAGGVTWDVLRFDHALQAGNPVVNTYCIDLNDALFTPGDTVLFFYGAKSNDVAGTTTWFSLDAGGAALDDIEAAAAQPMEFTCLPAGGYNRGGTVLYVDGMDNRGAQPYWDHAFQQLSLAYTVDRFDVRGPTSRVNNRLAGRVYDVGTQITGCYRQIYWDCGDLSVTLGDGFGSPEKTDDYGLVNTFLGGLSHPGGVYICGDDVASQLNLYSSPSTVAFRSTYLSYTFVASEHRRAYGISPVGVHNPSGLFDDDVIVYGGCPLLNDFDVMRATGSAVAEMTYGPANGNNAAVISQYTQNGNGVSVGVVFSGFAFEYIRDDDTDGISDRAKHLYDIRTALGDVWYYPTPAGPAPRNDLAQNVPNPFNPVTTIGYSLAARAPVRLVIYDVAGARVRTLVDDTRAAGAHAAQWDGRDDAGTPVSSGVYFCRITAGSFSKTRKMVLLK